MKLHEEKIMEKISPWKYFHWKTCGNFPNNGAIFGNYSEMAGRASFELKYCILENKRS